MAHKQSGELKKRAWLAKQRLKMGYWTAAEDDAQRFLAVTRAAGDTKKRAAEERLYERVCEILDRDEATLNPIGQLIDGEVYEKLDAAARQRYILELSNKFGELKERYYRERTGA